MNQASVPTPAARVLRVLLIATVALIAGWTRSAAAHDPFEITTHVRVYPEELDLTITMARGTALKMCPEAASDAGAAPPLGFEAQRPAFERCALGLYAVSGGGTELRPREARAILTVENDVELRVVLPGPDSGPLRLEGLFFARLPDANYGAVVTAHADREFLAQQLINADVPSLELQLPAHFAKPSSASATPATPVTPSFAEYLRLGVEHIWTGYDHLLFLLGLLAVCRRWRSILGIVTCFTVAHSVTLVLAALDVFTLPSRWVEPLIAASIVFVGVENLVRGAEPKGRWALTFAFGLIHGFGFAGVLRELGLGAGGAPIVLPVFAFNLGVELGQAAVAGVALPILLRLQQRPAVARGAAVVLSVLVTVLGAYWFVERTLLA